MKKVLALLLTLLILLLAACAGGAPATPADAESAEGEAAAGATEVTYMLWGSPEELTVWQAIVDEFEAAHPDISVNVEVSDWDSYWNKLQTLFAGNTPPDLFAMDAPLYPDWQSRGVLLNLDSYLEANPELTAGLFEGPLASYATADGYYGLPRDFQTIVLFYNKDLFDAAGVAYPTDDWTMEDLRSAAKQLTLDTDGDGVNDQWGLNADLWDMELFWGGAIWGHGGEVISEDRTQTLLGEPAAREAWQLISEMTTVDGSIPDPDTAAQFGDAFAAGVAAMTTIGHWVVPEYAQLDFAWDVAAFPAGPVRRATSVNSAGFVIAAEADAPDAAFEFIKFALSEAGQSRLTELGFALPVLKSVAESPVFLEQQGAAIRQQVFLDATEYAVTKPAFRGYDEWATIIGDGLVPVWTGEAEINATLDELVPAADEVLAANQ